MQASCVKAFALACPDSVVPTLIALCTPAQCLPFLECPLLALLLFAENTPAPPDPMHLLLLSAGALEEVICLLACGVGRQPNPSQC